MKSRSNCANHLCHTEGEPREPVLSAPKDGVVGGRVFAAVSLSFYILGVPLQLHLEFS
jgi:hypothetical protein